MEFEELFGVLVNEVADLTFVDGNSTKCTLNSSIIESFSNAVPKEHSSDDKLFVFDLSTKTWIQIDTHSVTTITTRSML